MLSMVHKQLDKIIYVFDKQLDKIINGFHEQLDRIINCFQEQLDRIINGRKKSISIRNLTMMIQKASINST